MAFQAPAAPGGGRARRQRAIRESIGKHAPDLYEATHDMVRNICTVYDNSTDVERSQGRLWYPNAAGWAVATVVWAQVDHGVILSTDSVIGIMAALSPSTDWDRNLSLARDLIATGDCAHAYGECIGKARRIRDGGSPDAVLGGRKVRSFYQCIRNSGRSGHVVIDRHAHAVALGVTRPLGDWAAKALDAPARYQLVAGAYRTAARYIDEPVSAVQATTWLTFRRLHGGRGGRGYGVTAAQAEEF